MEWKRNKRETKSSGPASNLATFLISVVVSIFVCKTKVTGPAWRTFLFHLETKAYAEPQYLKKIK